MVNKGALQARISSQVNTSSSRKQTKGEPRRDGDLPLRQSGQNLFSNHDFVGQILLTSCYLYTVLDTHDISTSPNVLSISSNEDHCERSYKHIPQHGLESSRILSDLAGPSQESANFCKEPDHKSIRFHSPNGFCATAPHCGSKAAVNNTYTNGCGCGPINLNLQKGATGQMELWASVCQTLG